MDTPSQMLAEEIVERLVQEKLLTAETGKKLAPLLAAGKVRSEDWRLPVELAGESKP